MAAKRNWLEALHNLFGRYTGLLVMLLAVTMLSPFTAYYPTADRVLDVAVLLMIISAVGAVWRHRFLSVIALIIGLASFVGLLIQIVGHIEYGRSISFALRFAFTILVTVSIFGDVLRSKRVTMDTVFGACSVYLLMAVSWANVYLLMETVSPESFQLALSSGEDVVNNVGAAGSQLYYFSLITLTTVGYGDILPLTAPARSLAALEGVVGQLYIAVIIARLVALEVSARMSGQP